MTPWTILQNNGWFPRISPDGKHLMVGAAVVRIYRLLDHVLVFEGPDRSWSMGWISPTLALYSQELPNTAVRPIILVDVATGKATPFVSSDLGQMGGFASNSHWATWNAAALSLIVDGQAIDGRHYGILQNGEWIQTANEAKDTLEIYRGITSQRVIHPSTPPFAVALSEQGAVAYGLGSDIRINFPDGREQRQPTSALIEGPFALCADANGELVLWTHACNDWSQFIMGRRVGEIAGICIPTACAGSDVVLIGDEWIVASTEIFPGSVCRCTVQSIPIAAPRVVLVPPAPPITPLVLPPPRVYGAAKIVTWWSGFRTAIQESDASFPHIDPPQNAAFVQGKEAQGATGPLLLIWTDTAEQALPVWDRVLAVVLHAEGATNETLPAQTEAIRQWMRDRKVPVRPITAYTGGAIVPEGQDWIMAQTYFTSAPTARQFSDLLAKSLAFNKPVLLCGQMYCRLIPEFLRDPNVVANLAGLYSDALLNPNVVGVTLFAWNRGLATAHDGAVWHDCMQQAVRVLVAGAGTPAPTITEDPPPVEPPPPTPEPVPPPTPPVTKRLNWWQRFLKWLGIRV